MKTKPEVSAALFVSLGSYDFKIDNPCVLRFETKSEAEDFLFETLVKFGELRTYPDGTISSRLWIGEPLEPISYENRSEATYDWQSRLGASEYFHVYECRDVIES